MIITTGAHIYESTPVHVALRTEQEGGHEYMVLNIGEDGQMTVFINDRAKALEIASQLELAAQKMKGEDCES